MADELRFYGWQRSSVYALATGAQEQGRLLAELPLTLRERDNPANSVSDTVGFVIAGPGDVGGLQPQAVHRVYPTANHLESETTKFAHIEFAAADLPWRYTPKLTNSDALRPWFVLVVGTADEISLLPQHQLTLSSAVTAAHPLTQSARWAHVQDDGQHSLARVLSPRVLAANTAYIAALVPSFQANGADRWMGGVAITLPYYYSWRFQTGEGGDFEALASALKPGSANPSLGRAPLTYERLDPPAALEIRGAIAPLFSADDPLPTEVVEDLKTLNLPLSDPRNRPIIGLPKYGAEWGDPWASLWGQAINGDPRQRGVAGLGLKAGVELQELLMDAAVSQAGALGEAAQRVRHLALGLVAARSLWTRRLPTDPMQRLKLYGPSLRRMPTASGSVLDTLSGAGRPLPASLFSTAAHRTLRAGTARVKFAAPGAANFGRIMRLANLCPTPPVRVQDGTPHADTLSHDLGIPSLETVLKQSLELKATSRTRLPVISDTERNARRDLLELLSIPYQMEPCAPVDVFQLEKRVTASIDPTVKAPLVQRRVLDGIEGLGEYSLAPVEVCFGLDFPAWVYLRDHAPDWLLPGIAEMPHHAVLAFESNPAFVESFLLGLNSQVIAELRWRNIPLATGCTPVRMFWGQFDAVSGQRKADIRGVNNWANNSPLGDPSHGVPPLNGNDLILAIRSDLFRRYPNTLIYIVQPVLNDEKPDWSVDPSFSDRLFPAFQGKIGEDIVFFQFDLPPSVARQRWLVLEEPPLGISFRNDQPVAAGVADGGAFALATIDDTLRVLIRGETLIPAA
jgi:hypothetical protein